MKNNCIICTKRRTCVNYQIGGLLIDTYCDRFREEKELSEAEQIALEEKRKVESLRKV